MSLLTTMIFKKLFYLVIVAAILTVGFLMFAVFPMKPTPNLPEPIGAISTQDQELLNTFSMAAHLERKDFEDLEAYFQNGFIAYRDKTGSSASYPGLPSSHRHHTDNVEGFTRIAPLMAMYLRYQTQPRTYQAIQARKCLLTGWAHGADPNSNGYWGTINDNDQLIVEASDVALSVWLLRDSLWLDLAPTTRNDLIRWLLQVNHRRIPDNNWHLFVTFVDVVVSSLNYPSDMSEARRHYARFRTFYRGGGWFSDGPDMRFDYYNAWGIHYQLFWIDQVNPTFDHLFIPQAINEFSQKLQYLIGPRGVPIMGRSICYRMAIASPLILAQNFARPSVAPGVARRALAATWQYFIANGGVRDGRITQGYCGFDARLLDSYSGPASCQWGLRSLISALYLDPSSAFWTAPDAALPVEQLDYTISYPQPGWTVIGRKPYSIIILTGSPRRPSPMVEENPMLALLDHFTGSVHRPDNEEAKYRQREYRSDAPFCGCAHE